jgi:hypothetical protein
VSRQLSLEALYGQNQTLHNRGRKSPWCGSRNCKDTRHAKVNILALLGTAQGTGGSVQLVVEDAKRAKKALDEAKLSYTETTAEEIELPNKPGALAQTLNKLAAKGVNLNSICATASKGGKKAVVVYTVGQAEAKAAEATTAA